MDNKALAEFVRLEVGKVITAINKLTLKISQPRKNEETAEKQDNYTKKATHSTERNSLSVAVPPANTHHAESRKDNPKPRRTMPRRIFRYVKRIFLKKDWLNRIALVAGIIYAAVTWCQWRDMRANFQLDQRPYVFFKPPGPVQLAPPDNRLAANMFFMNTGKTPALHTKFMGWIFYGEKTDKGFRLPAIEVDQWFSKLDTAEGLKEESGSVIGEDILIQGDSPVQRLVLGHGTASSIDIPYMIGVRILYFDKFGNPYWTDVCFSHMLDENPPARCSSHNDIH